MEVETARLAFVLSPVGRWVGTGLILAVLIGGLYGLYRYQKHRADNLEAQVQALSLGQQVILEAQQATKKFNAGKDQEQRREANEQAQIDTVVESGDSVRMRSLFESHGMLRPQRNPAPGR